MQQFFDMPSDVSSTVCIDLRILLYSDFFRTLHCPEKSGRLEALSDSCDFGCNFHNSIRDDLSLCRQLSLPGGVVIWPISWDDRSVPYLLFCLTVDSVEQWPVEEILCQRLSCRTCRRSIVYIGKQIDPTENSFSAFPFRATVRRRRIFSGWRRLKLHSVVVAAADEYPSSSSSSIESSFD